MTLAVRASATHAPPELCEHRQGGLGCGLALTAQAPVQEVLQGPVQALVALLLVCALYVCAICTAFRPRCMQLPSECNLGVLSLLEGMSLDMHD